MSVAVQQAHEVWKGTLEKYDEMSSDERKSAFWNLAEAAGEATLPHGSRGFLGELIQEHGWDLEATTPGYTQSRLHLLLEFFLFVSRRFGQVTRLTQGQAMRILEAVTGK